ncbi:unnamed protein product [Thelazia callipaeda]|uniref:Immunoglobulin I-set domain protein n=1 Tax=Thelazia callipaeda TaxID=103827 RepID=A0A0N5DBR2_THECL|nr:unnamed protein product [Thelazia callipaeda]
MISNVGVNHHLAIRNVQASDNGRFTAQAMNAAGTKQSTCMLIVAPAPTPIPGTKSIVSVPNSPVPPQTPVGPSAPIFLKELRNLPLKLGTQIILEARVVGSPEPHVEWLKNKLPLKNYRTKIEYDARTGICALIIPQMFADDVGEYTCRATNTHGIAETSAEVTYLILLPRNQFEKWFNEQQSLITRERKLAMLAQTNKQQKPGTVCSFFTSDEKVYLCHTVLESIRSYVQDVNSQIRQSGSQQTASVTQRQMKQITQNGSSDYDSISEIPWALSESETEAELASINSRGIGGPPRIQAPLNDLRLTEGTDAILQCTITGNPKPKITWLKNGEVIDLINSKGITALFKGSLAMIKITSVVAEDSGEYALIAENYYGKIQNEISTNQQTIQYLISSSAII